MPGEGVGRAVQEVREEINMFGWNEKSERNEFVKILLRKPYSFKAKVKETKDRSVRKPTQEIKK